MTTLLQKPLFCSVLLMLSLCTSMAGQVLTCPTTITSPVTDLVNCEAIVTWLPPTEDAEIPCFDGTLDDALWVINLDVNATGATDGAIAFPDNCSLTLEASGNGSAGVDTYDEICIDITCPGTISFDWDAENLEGGVPTGSFNNDEPSFVLGGVETMLATAGNMADGTVTGLAVLAGDQFCFRVNSGNAGAKVQLDITNFVFEPVLTIAQVTTGSCTDISSGDSLAPGTYTVCYQAIACDAEVDVCAFQVVVEPCPNGGVLDCPNDITMQVTDAVTCQVPVTWDDAIGSPVDMPCFQNQFDALAWTHTIDVVNSVGTDGIAVFTDPCSLSMVATGDGTAGEDTYDEICIDVTCDGEISFDWLAENLEDGILSGTFNNDEPSYVVTGTETMLAIGADGDTASGSETGIAVTIGDQFCFRVNTRSAGAEVNLSISNFAFEATTTVAQYTVAPCTPLSSGSLFDPGLYTVCYTAEACGEIVDFCSFDLVVQEYTPGNLSCQNIHVSLNEDCEGIVTPDMVLTMDDLSCIDNYEVEIFATDGTSLGDQVGADQIGQTLDYTVCLPILGQCCWGSVTIEDKLPPEIECEDVTIACNALPSVAPPAIIDDNCAGGSIMLVNEVINDLPCDPDFTGCIVRTYRATDAAGAMSMECDQKIFLRRVDLSLVTFPVSTTLQCDDNFATDSNGHPAPSVSGVPLNAGVGIFPEIPDELCNVFLTYVDVVVPTDDCSDKFMRTWELREWWCGGEITIGGFQIIDVLDNTGPELTCGDDFTVSTQYGCTSSVEIPAILATDACNEIESYLINTGSGVLHTNGGNIELAEGVHTVTYTVFDACYNSSECSIEVTVQDLTEPVAICEQNTVVSIGQSGESVVYATAFDDGSLDECGPVTIDVRRMEDSCAQEDNTEWGEKVIFCCSDVGTTQMVALRVTDSSGNTNVCMVSVSVQDKLPPTMTCPDDLVIDCTEAYDLDNLGLFYGNPVVSDNCANASNVVETVDEDVNTCGLGQITRTFTLDRGNGLDPLVCVQNIFVENNDPFDFQDVVWPDDVSSDNACNIDDFHPDLLPVDQSYPQFSEDQCDLVGMNYEDEVFEFVIGTDACVKILRKWKVIDWCQTTNTEVAVDSFTQILKLNNTIDPEIGECSDITLATLDAGCNSAQVTVLAPSVTDDCTPDQQVQWQYEITFASGAIVNGNGPDASRDYPLGTHVITWTALDRCGNFDACSHEITVVNEKLPIPICINGLSVDLTPMDLDNDGTIDAEMSSLWASDFNNGSYHQCGYDVTVSFSTDITDTNLVLDCSHLGIEEVDMYVTVLDEFGNPLLDSEGNPLQSYCTTFVEVQDNNDVDFCPDITDPAITGRIALESGVELVGAQVNLINGAATEITDNSGTYNFGTMPFGGSYVVQPYHNVEHPNGVSTLDIILIQRHIMNIQPLASAYQMIAADANNSGSISAADLVDIRKLILEMYTEYPSNTSWKFVDKDQVFIDQMNPWGQGLDEAYQILQLAQDMAIDFVAIKVGDVNGSVDINNAQGTIESREAPVQFRVEVSQNQIHLFAVEDVDLHGLQLELLLDGGVRELFSDLPNFNSNHYRIDGNKLRISYSGLQSTQIDEGDRVMSIMTDAATKLAVSASFQNEAYTGALVASRNIELITDKAEQFEISSYPNPWEDKVTIAIQAPIAASTVGSLVDNQGRKVKTINLDLKPGSNKVELNGSALKSGVYTFRVDFDGHTYSKRLLKLN